MGRTIKFRAWDEEEKVMIDGDSLAFEEYAPIKDLLTGDGIMQYTGLKDKNGVEIYEGDILQLWRSVGGKGELRGKYCRPLPVEYCVLWCQFVAVDKQFKEQYEIWKSFQAFEVIGNIYEDKHLLGDG